MTYSLAVAENILEFEHRDLHWGNVLIHGTEEASHSYNLNGGEYSVDSCGVKATIIDYTLSRMSYKGCIVYNDLEDDETLFRGSGDYQFDIYRLMRKKIK